MHCYPSCGSENNLAGNFKHDIASFRDKSSRRILSNVSGLSPTPKDLHFPGLPHFVKGLNQDQSHSPRMSRTCNLKFWRTYSSTFHPIIAPWNYLSYAFLWPFCIFGIVIRGKYYLCLPQQICSMSITSAERSAKITICARSLQQCCTCRLFLSRWHFHLTSLP